MGFSLGTLIGGGLGFLAGGLGGASLGASIGGGVDAQDAASNAADAQVGAANNATELQRSIFNKQTELNAPFRDNGLTAQNKLMTLLGLNGGEAGAGDFGKYAKDFSMSDFQQDPGYKWRLEQGQKALDRSASARGGMFSGRAAKDLTNYGQGAASQEYGNAFNRYQVNRNNQLNPLQSLSGAGQTATGQTQQAAQNYGNAASSNIMSAGNANASGYLGSVNGMNNAVGSGLNAYQNYTMMNKLFPPTSGGYSSFGGGSGTFGEGQY
ncbi:hypothetical protein UFOVP607_61 [uncultured Caudovirales phage]|uniref:DNA transfer protein n=1 Tax=uncultured Caudovirales phage TaxID=2100421 RepID=A0A6J5N105_9CAUD|nr:hypothetical protein UFOVP607_61 [uncultured Caudovirales phage]